MAVTVRLASDERAGRVLELRALRTWCERLRGLLGTDEGAPAVLLARCASVHTFGMRYAIDVAFVGERGEVLLVCRGLLPGRAASCPGAACAVERPAREGDWLEQGEHLWIVSVSADAA